MLWCDISVLEFVIQHHRNAAQLAPVVRTDTAGFHGHREEGGRGVRPPSHIWPRGCVMALSSDKWLEAGTTKRYTCTAARADWSHFAGFCCDYNFTSMPVLSITMHTIRNDTAFWYLLYLVNIKTISGWENPLHTTLTKHFTSLRFCCRLNFFRERNVPKQDKVHSVMMFNMLFTFHYKAFTLVYKICRTMQCYGCFCFSTSAQFSFFSPFHKGKVICHFYVSLCE